MNTDQHSQALAHAIATLQAQRATLGDPLVDAALAPLLKSQAALGVNAEPDRTAEPTRRLRQVSVLFLDVVGSTQLIQRLDPESVQLVVDGALAAFTALVGQHGGEVLRYAGDSIKAAFGADVSREDDAERAVACGLALLNEAARCGQEVLQIHGLAGFDARVGIHTGPVVRGGGIEQENSLSGLAVNIAARMEQAAAPGTLRISMDTWRLVQGRFDAVEQPALIVKGLTEPMRTLLVRGARDRKLRGLRRGADGVSAALVGRREELLQAQRVVGAVLAPGGGLGALTLLGEAGLGKSRLLTEIQTVLAESQSVPNSLAIWRGASHPQGLYQPYGLLRDLLFWHLGVRESDSQAQAQRRFGEALAPLFGSAAEEQTALLGQLFGLDYSASPFVVGIVRDGAQLRALGLNAWVRLLRQQAATQPLLLVLDDLQWADDASLDALDHLVATAPELPVMLLCAARPELLQRRPQWGQTWPRYALLPLAPLSAAGCDTLAQTLLSRFATPPLALQALLTAQSAGNPFYMEALLQLMLDRGVIEIAADHWQLHESKLNGLAVPPTLVGVLQATLDALNSDALRALQQASVVGAQFWDEALAAIDVQAPHQLPGLSQRELARPLSPSAFEGTLEYSFRHHLLHQVTYGTVLKADKRQAHGLAARWLQGRSAGRENELAGQIAEHFERAGDKPLALAYWLRAAEDASRRHADIAALAHSNRALALDDGIDLPRSVRIHRVRGDVFVRAGDSAAHGRELDTLEALADQLDDDLLRLALANDRGWRLFMEGRFEEGVQLAEQRLARAEARAPRDAGRVHNVACICLSRLGRADEAQAHALKGLEQAHAAGDLNTEAAIHTNLGIEHIESNRLGPALSHFDQALLLYQAAGNRSGLCNVRLNLSAADQALGRSASARDLQLQVLRESRETGARRFEAMASANLGVALSELGDGQAGYDHALKGLALARFTGETRTQAWAHHGAQAAARVLGRHADALTHAQAACTLFKTHGDRNMAWINAGAAVHNLHLLGRLDEARTAADALLDEAQGHGGEGSGWDDAWEPPFDVYGLFAALGDPQAAGLLEVAYRNLDLLADKVAACVSRDEFLDSTIASRRLCAAWAAAQAGVAGAVGHC